MKKKKTNTSFVFDVRGKYKYVLTMPCSYIGPDKISYELKKTRANSFVL